MADSSPSRRPAASMPPAVDEVWFPSEAGGDLETSRRHEAAAVPDAETPISRRRELSRVSRWALPILTLIVVLETGWLLSGFFGVS